ncbi:hypothetical protein P2G88_02085 [Aliiglaciecola sp. CAU 1673]|uniref:hypothetical protein n=1 Tax=Aliiglaciecola sp. CAU 1673 TaxID=3032595 RepID=UPI0023DB7206|nr:hypothetical protein [Aliiglaciecola sp. CAU 1673]MDF2177040.1 hypothetical protein [Aliiglaciecola sp. CAU 1673]
MTVIYILAILFIALIIIIPLLERSKLRMSDEQVGRYSRWIWPLVMILLIAQLIRMIVEH